MKHDPQDQFQWALSQMETIKSFAFNYLHLGKLANNLGGPIEKLLHLIGLNYLNKSNLFSL